MNLLIEDFDQYIDSLYMNNHIKYEVKEDIKNNILEFTEEEGIDLLTDFEEWTENNNSISLIGAFRYSEEDDRESNRGIDEVKNNS